MIQRIKNALKDRPSEDQFVEAVKAALGGEPAVDPMLVLRRDLESLKVRTRELSEGIEKLSAELG